MKFEQQLLAGAKHLKQHDPVLSTIISTHGKCTIKPHDNYYGELLDSIVSQQLSVKAAATICGRLKAHFQGNYPTPEQILTTDPETIRGFGLSMAKVGYVQDLAQHILDGRLDLKHISTLSDEELIHQLTDIKGIGEWTAHMFMMFSLGRLNILAWGDLGVRKAAQLAYELPTLPNKQQLIELSETHGWQPFQTIACWYLWKSLDNAPTA